MRLFSRYEPLYLSIKLGIESLAQEAQEEKGKKKAKKGSKQDRGKSGEKGELVRIEHLNYKVRF